MQLSAIWVPLGILYVAAADKICADKASLSIGVIFVQLWFYGAMDKWA